MLIWAGNAEHVALRIGRGESRHGSDHPAEPSIPNAAHG
jgi:hypothetical protein